MKILCKMSGEEHTLPCPTPSCPLFGDCMAFYESQFYKPMTNADHIRAMSDEELAKEIMCPYSIEPDMCNSMKTCNECCLEWLKMPVEE